jgi:hypothetical protein
VANTAFRIKDFRVFNWAIDAAHVTTQFTGGAKCFINTWAQISGDPHFTSFSGGNYEVMGKPGHFYNIVSDKHLQINAQFVGGRGSTTWIGAFSVQYNGHSVTYDVENQELMFDNEKNDVSSVGNQVWHLSADKKSYISKTRKSPDATARIHVKVPGYFFVFTRKHEVRPLYKRYFAMKGDQYKGKKVHYMDIHSEKVDTDGAEAFVFPHGLLGQTARFNKPVKAFGDGKYTSRQRNGEGVIEGTYEDYEVPDLLSNEFKFNQYKK